MRRLAETTKTYVIHSECLNYIKIGISGNVEQRFKNFKTSIPFKIVEIIVFDYDIERQLFAKFAHLRLQGEWFKYDQEIIDYVTSDKVNELINPFIEKKKEEERIATEKYQRQIEAFENRKFGKPNYTFPFGKYKGKLFKDVEKIDSSYIEWFNKNVSNK